MFLFNDALNTFYLRLYGRKCFYLTTHSTHFIYRRKCFYLTTGSGNSGLKQEGNVFILRRTQHILFTVIWKEVYLFNDALNTFYLRLYGRKCFYLTTGSGNSGLKQGRKCFYLTTHSTHFIYGYMEGSVYLMTGSGNWGLKQGRKCFI